jgi:predicted ferric reductase
VSQLSFKIFGDGDHLAKLKRNLKTWEKAKMYWKLNEFGIVSYYFNSRPVPVGTTTIASISASLDAIVLSVFNQRSQISGDSG